MENFPKKKNISLRNRILLLYDKRSAKARIYYTRTWYVRKRITSKIIWSHDVAYGRVYARERRIVLWGRRGPVICSMLSNRINYYYLRTLATFPGKRTGQLDILSITRSDHGNSEFPAKVCVCVCIYIYIHMNTCTLRGNEPNFGNDVTHIWECRENVRDSRPRPCHIRKYLRTAEYDEQSDNNFENVFKIVLLLLLLFYFFLPSVCLLYRISQLKREHMKRFFDLSMLYVAKKINCFNENYEYSLTFC